MIFVVASAVVSDEKFSHKRIKMRNNWTKYEVLLTIPEDLLFVFCCLWDSALFDIPRYNCGEWSSFLRNNQGYHNHTSINWKTEIGEDSGADCLSIFFLRL